MSAVIYTRISDDPRGKAAGVERQADECRALAAERGLNVIEEIEDNDRSATSGKKRPGFERVLRLVEAGTIDTVVIWHTDRLYRLPRDLEPLIDLASGGALRFMTVTASDIDLNTPSGRMVARMLAAASAQEVEHKADRQRSASDQRAARGEATMRPGYGLRRVENRVVEIPEEADVIREAVRRVLAGESLRSIAADLNARGVPSPSVHLTRVPQRPLPWEGVSVRRAIQRPSVAGLRVHRGKVIGKALGDVIVDRDSWDRLTALLNDPTRAPRRRGRGPQHLLSGLAVCGAPGCGAPVYRQAGWTPKPESKTRHANSPAYGCKACSGVRRAQEPVDAFVTEIVLRRLEKAGPDELPRPGADEGAVAEARSAIDTIDARLDNYADQAAEGQITDAQLHRMTARLLEKRKGHQAALDAAAPSAIPAEAFGSGAREAWESFDIEIKRGIVRELMDVTILPTGAGGRTFDPESVRIDWR